MVQCRLLYSLALFWYDYKAESKMEMEKATRLALDLHMFSQDFAAKHGADDPVLRECWRRTWWMVYVVDAYYAGTLGTMNFDVVDIEATVDLPCEESEFESGVSTDNLLPHAGPFRRRLEARIAHFDQNIPAPKTLEEFDCREFSPESTFSSFAYLIGAVRCAASAISSAPKIANKDDSMHILQAADSSIDGWRLLLPESRKEVISKTGEIDELMFQAHLLIHV